MTWMKRGSLTALLLLLTACSDEDTIGINTFINVGISNSTSGTLTVDVGVVGSAGAGESLTAPPGYTSTEIPGTSGNVVAVTVSGGLSGTGRCTATNQIVGTSAYGEVGILETGGGTAQVTCLFGWVESAP